MLFATVTTKMHAHSRRVLLSPYTAPMKALLAAQISKGAHLNTNTTSLVSSSSSHLANGHHQGDGKIRIRFIFSELSDPEGEAEEEVSRIIRDVFVNPGDTLKDAAESAGIAIEASCGGMCKCSTCLVHILNGTRYAGEDGATEALRFSAGTGEEHVRNQSLLSGDAFPTITVGDLLLQYPPLLSPFIPLPPPDSFELDLLDVAVGRDEPLFGIIKSEEDLSLLSRGNESELHVGECITGDKATLSAQKSSSAVERPSLVVEGTSRLGCQIYVSEEMDGLVVRVGTGQTDLIKSNKFSSTKEHEGLNRVGNNTNKKEEGRENRENAIQTFKSTPAQQLTADSIDSIPISDSAGFGSAISHFRQRPQRARTYSLMSGRAEKSAEEVAAQREFKKSEDAIRKLESALKNQAEGTPERATTLTEIDRLHARIAELSEQFGFTGKTAKKAAGPPPKQAGPTISAASAPLAVTFTDEEAFNCIRFPTLTKDDTKLDAQVDCENVTPPPRLYRPNVAVYFFNEYGQILACLRKDGKSWQTVQGGIEDLDDVGSKQDTPATFGFRVHSPCDPRLLSAAVREIAEEIGLSDLASVGCEFVAVINPPSRAELEEILRKQKRGKKLSELELQQLDLTDNDPMRFFRYEFQGRNRKRSCVGQEQFQLLFFLPSESISKVNLIPDKSVYGPDVSMEFKAVAWMSVNQFLPQCASFKRSINAYVLTSTQFTAAVFGFLGSNGRKGVQQIAEESRELITLVSPHVPDCTQFVLPCQRRLGSPDVHSLAED